MTGDQTRIQLAPGRGIRDTLQIMVSLVHRRRDDRRVRDLALSITEGCAPLDHGCRMQRILSWARECVAYELDPRGGDLIHDPLDTIDRIGSYGIAAGDCDDGAVLIAALLESLGIETRLTAMSLRPDRKLHHVAVEALLAGQGWRMLDPFVRPNSGQRVFSALMKVRV